MVIIQESAPAVPGDPTSRMNFTWVRVVCAGRVSLHSTRACRPSLTVYAVLDGKLVTVVLRHVFNVNQESTAVFHLHAPSVRTGLLRQWQGPLRVICVSLASLQ